MRYDIFSNKYNDMITFFFLFVKNKYVNMDTAVNNLIDEI